LRDEYEAYLVNADDYSDYLFAPHGAVSLMYRFCRNSLSLVGVLPEFERFLDSLVVLSSSVICPFTDIDLFTGEELYRARVTAGFPCGKYLIIQLAKLSLVATVPCGFIVFDYREERFVGSTSHVFKGVSSPELASLMMNVKEIAW